MRTSSEPAPNGFQQNDPHDPRLRLRQAAGGGADSRKARRRVAAATLRRLLEHAACRRRPPVASPRGAARSRAKACRPHRVATTSAAATIERPRARWVAVRWSDLPGWDADRVERVLAAFLRSCERPAPGWLDACAKARQRGPAAASETAVRDWLQRQLRPYRDRVDRARSGRPGDRLLRAARRRVARRRGPGFASLSTAPPADLATRTPVLDAPADRDAAGGAEEPAGPRDRLGARPPRCAPAPGAGLGPARLRRRARRRAGDSFASPTRGTTTSPTDRSAAG